MTISIAFTDPNLYLSGSWIVNSTTYIQANSGGSVLKVGFTGTSIAFSITGTTAGGYAYLSVDNGAPQYYNLTNSGTLSVTGLTAGNHQATLWAMALSAGYDRWINPISVLKVTQISIDNGASTLAPTLKTKKALVYGDSITYGTGTLNTATSSYDSTQGYGYLLGEALDAEITLRGFEASGLTVNNGSTTVLGNLPIFYTEGDDINSSWNKIDSTHSLLTSGVYTIPYDYVIMNLGTNDFFYNTLVDNTKGTDAQVSNTLSQVLPKIRAAAPNAYIIVIIPFAGYKRSALLAGMSLYQATTNDAKTFTIDLGTYPALIQTNPYPNLFTADGTHPTIKTYAVLATRLSSAIAKKVDLLTTTNKSPTSPAFGGKF